MDLSSLARRLHGQDASLYEELPSGVVRPHDAEDCVRLVRAAIAHAIPLIPRGGGTSLAGQCVGSGLVVDVSRHMRRILGIDPARAEAVVEPGVVQDDLNDASADGKLVFGPDTSTSKQATLGGMIGNNSCGAYSIVHGTTREHVLEVEVVLGDGSRARFGDVSDGELEERKSRPSLEGRIYREILDLIGKHREAILADYPKPRILRRNTGYALDVLARSRPWEPSGPPFNLARLLCGSEGTLALVTEAKVRLVPRPRTKLLVTAHFRSVDEACSATVQALGHSPAAIELLDGILLEATKGNREQAANRFWVEGDPGAVLVVEFQGDRAEALEERARGLVDDLRAHGFGYAFPFVAAKDAAKVWALRKAGLGLLTGIPGDAKPVTAIEDTAVAPEDLPAYVKDIAAIMERNGCSCVYYGHASVGLLHLRPMLNLKDAADLRRFEAILDETTDLVKHYGGSLSGEHGDGRLRGPYLPRMFSPEVWELHRRVKRLFDPHGIFNPGKIVDAPSATTALRTHPRSRTPEIETIYDWSATQGLVRATEACNGAGFCRQSAGRGTMCPSYMATGEEAYTTRGRANVLRQLLTGDAAGPGGDPRAPWRDPDLKAVMDTCLSCKGCSSECPSNVDMARLKGEYLQRRMDLEGVPLRSFLIGNFGVFARLSRVAPGLASWVMNLGVVKRVLGFAPARQVPPYAKVTFETWFRRHVPHPNAGKRGEIALFVDEFTNFTDPHVGRAAAQVLEAAGYRIEPICRLDSGRAYISKGFLRAARKRFTRAIAALLPLVRRGLPIVGLEPSAILGFRDEAPDLVPGEIRLAALEVKGAVFLFEEFLARESKAGKLDLVAWKRLEPSSLLVHGHCQAKALAGMDATLAALRLVPGLEVVPIASGCCGMAGSFGYEREHYELSLKVAELVLFPAIRARPEAWICAPGTSCRHQIADGTGRTALHPAEVLHRALFGSRS